MPKFIVRCYTLVVWTVLALLTYIIRQEPCITSIRFLFPGNIDMNLGVVRTVISKIPQQYDGDLGNNALVVEYINYKCSF